MLSRSRVTRALSLCLVITALVMVQAPTVAAHASTVSDVVDTGPQVFTEVADVSEEAGAWCFEVTDISGVVTHVTLAMRGTDDQWVSVLDARVASGLRVCTDVLPSGRYDLSLKAAGGQPGSSVTVAVEHPEAPPRWKKVGSLITARDEHTTTLLGDGRLLVVGGWRDCPGEGLQIGTCRRVAGSEIFDVATGTSHEVPMLIPRVRHTATLLSDGRVLVLGGIDEFYGTRGSAQMIAEIFDPATNQWSVAGTSLLPGREHHTATLLPSGKVLVVQGRLAEIFDPESGLSLPTMPLPSGHSGHVAIPLDDGRVLIAGGNTDRVAHIFDPTSGTWSETRRMAQQRFWGAAVPMADGRVLVTGGWAFGTATYTDSAEIYDPATNSWSDAAPFHAGRSHHSLTPLPDGTFLLVGGRNSSLLTLPRLTAQRYDPATDSWTTLSELHVARSYHAATALADGSVAVTGGYRIDNEREGSIEVFEL